MKNTSQIVQVALPVPLSSIYDYYLPPDTDTTHSLIGCRVRVPFGRSTRIGVIVQTENSSTLPADKIKPIETLLDLSPILPNDLIKLLLWGSRYYQHPIGEVMATALPQLLRSGQPLMPVCSWRLTPKGASASLGGATLQRRIIEQLQAYGALNEHQLSLLSNRWHSSIERLREQALVEPCEDPLPPSVMPATDALPLNAPQQAALEAIRATDGQFQAHLLDGATGSGKTEIYLQAGASVLASKRQMLLIVPEISLIPQLAQRFTERFGAVVATMHSGLNARQRLLSWQLAGRGIPVLIGTRSSVFAPMPRLGLIVVDEEHDASLKQQDGFHYHARDLALVRAQHASIPIVLGSATPSLESLHNAQSNRYTHLKMPGRIQPAILPAIQLLDLRGITCEEGLSATLLGNMRTHLQAGNQVLLFLNRRGYVPVVLCGDCESSIECRHCSGRMTLHTGKWVLRCHLCGDSRAMTRLCPSCGSRNLLFLGQGTQRIEQALAAHFPQDRIVRVDRDNTRKKGTIAQHLQMAHSGEAHILIGTQMLAKGHHFPNVTLAGILDIDQRLYSADFRAGETLAQLLLQVAGRAGRGAQRGEVLIQTHNPNHPLFRTLLQHGYHAAAQEILQERRAVGWPPYTHLALVRSRAHNRADALALMRTVRTQIEAWQPQAVEVLGPAMAPIERIARQYRAQLVLLCEKRPALHALAAQVRATLESMNTGRVHWSLDIDPTDLS